MANRKRLGIIQSRGLGDILIALPIAKHYHDEGWDIVWPICDIFMDNVVDYVPWVKWVPVPTDPRGSFFYDVPMERLGNLKVDEVLPLYQALTGHPEFSEELYFQHTSFDQYKYIKAGVPFHKKWTLAECLTRHPDREQALRDRVITNPDYAVIHLEGSDHRAAFDPGIIPTGWQTVYVESQSKSIFDWIGILDGAQSIVCVDSCIANLVDQLALGEDRYFIPRSHIGLTPVHGQHWRWVKF